MACPAAEEPGQVVNKESSRHRGCNSQVVQTAHDLSTKNHAACSGTQIALYSGPSASVCGGDRHSTHAHVGASASKGSMMLPIHMPQVVEADLIWSVRHRQRQSAPPACCLLRNYMASRAWAHLVPLKLTSLHAYSMAGTDCLDPRRQSEFLYFF